MCKLPPHYRCQEDESRPQNYQEILANDELLFLQNWKKTQKNMLASEPLIVIKHFLANRR